MTYARPALICLAAAVLGAVAVFLIVLVGWRIGESIETRTGLTVVSWEMAPLAAWVFGTPSAVLAAVLGAISGRWWRGVALGLLIHGLYFGCLLLWARGNPLAVNCWFYAVGTVAGGAAGAMGGAVGPLYLLHSTNSVELAEAFLDAGAELDGIDPDGATPLHRAVVNGFVDVAVFLIQKGADIDIENEEGKTPIDIARTSLEEQDLRRVLDAVNKRGA